MIGWPGQGQGQGQGQEGNCANPQDLELKRGREGTLQHGPGAILEGAIGSGRQSGWLREILGPEGCPRTMFLNCNEEIKRKKERTIGNQNVPISTFCSRDRALVLALLLLLTSAWLLTLGRCATRIVRRCVFYSLKERGAE